MLQERWSHGASATKKKRSNASAIFFEAAQLVAQCALELLLQRKAQQ
jgi:hypothetical protein